MGRRLPPQVRTCLRGGLLQQQRHPLRSPATASTGHVPRCLASSANNGATVKNRSSALTPASHSSSLALVPFVPFAVARWKNEQCYSLTPDSAYSSTTSSGSAGVVVVESSEDFENALNKVEEGAIPAILYFSATWCGPCKLLAPVVTELSKSYPDCVTYKIDIDMEGIDIACEKMVLLYYFDIEGIQNKLSDLGISAVPTLNFYKDGKIAATVVGADVQKIKGIMDQFYK